MQSFASMNDLPLFSNIDHRDLPAMLQCLGCTRKLYRKGEYLLNAGDKATFVGAILNGRIQILKEDYHGNSSIYMNLHPGQLFGETFVCASMTLLPVSYKSASDSEVLTLPLQKLLHTCPRACTFHMTLIKNLVQLMARKNLFYANKFEILANASIRDRLMTYLFQLSREQSSTSVLVPLNRTELASYLSVNRSALAREMKKLEKDGTLIVEKNIFILNLS